MSSVTNSRSGKYYTIACPEVHSIVYIFKRESMPETAEHIHNFLTDMLNIANNYVDEMAYTKYSQRDPEYSAEGFWEWADDCDRIETFTDFNSLEEIFDTYTNCGFAKCW
jgi:hypothetical protein